MYKRVRKIAISNKYKQILYKYLYNYFAEKNKIQPLPAPYTDCPKKYIDPNGVDVSGYLNDAQALAMAHVAGGYITVETDKAYTIGKMLAKQNNFKIEKGIPEVNIEDNNTILSIGYDMDMNLLENVSSPIDQFIGSDTSYELFEALHNSKNKDYPLLFLAKDPVMQELRGHAFNEEEKYSILDLVIEAQKQKPELFKEIDDAFFSFYLHLFVVSNDFVFDTIVYKLLDDFISGQEEVFFKEHAKEYNQLIKKIITPGFIDMSNFNYADSKDAMWASLNLSEDLLKQIAEDVGCEITTSDIVVGVNNYNKGDRGKVTEEYVEKIEEGIKDAQEGKAVEPEVKKEIEKAVEKKEEITAKAEQVLGDQQLGISKEVDEKTEVKQGKKVSEILESPWDIISQRDSRSIQSSFENELDALYTKLFEAGFLRKPMGVLYFHDNKPKKEHNVRILTVGPDLSIESKKQWITKRRLKPEGIGHGELLEVRPDSREDMGIFNYYTKGVQSKEAHKYALTVLEGKSPRLGSTKFREMDSDIYTIKLKEHPKIIEKMFKNYKQCVDHSELKYTYAPFLIAEFAYGLLLENGNYKASGLGWQDYHSIITQEIRSIYLNIQRVCYVEAYMQILNKERKKDDQLEIGVNTTYKEITEHARKNDLIGKLSDTKTDYEDNFMDIVDGFFVEFCNYVKKSLSICSIMRIFERDITGTKLIQYRARISDPIGITKSFDSKNEPINDGLIIAKALLDTKGDSLKDMQILTPESVLQGSLEGQHVIETGVLMNAKLVESVPMFAYKEVKENAKNGYYPVWNKMPVGRFFDGQPFTNGTNNFLNNVWHLIIAGSRAGKGVMTMTFLSAAALNKSTIVYLDNKPDMSATLYSLLNHYGVKDGLQIPIVNGGHYGSEYDKPINTDEDRTLPIAERYKASVLGSSEASWLNATNNKGEKLIPEYLYQEGGMEDFKDSWAGVIGHNAYFRLFTLLNGIMLYKLQAKANKLKDCLEDFGRLCFIVDEYNIFTDGFSECYTTKLFPQLPPIETAYEKVLKESLNKVKGSYKKKEKQAKKKNESVDLSEYEEELEDAYNTFLEENKDKIGPLNMYALSFIKTIGRGCAQITSLSSALGVNMREGVEYPVDMYMIGQHATFHPLATQGITESSISGLIGGGELYRSIGYKGVSKASYSEVKNAMYQIPTTWLRVGRNQGIDMCLGYNKDHKNILFQAEEDVKEGEEAVKPKQPKKVLRSQSKLTENARYFAYIKNVKLDKVGSGQADFDVLDDKITTKDDAMYALEKRATYFKPYLVLNDNSFQYTDGLVSSITGEGIAGLPEGTKNASNDLSLTELFTSFGDEKTKEHLYGLMGQGQETQNIDRTLVYTEEQRKALKERTDERVNLVDAPYGQNGDYYIPKLDDGVGLIGYMDSVCDLIQKEREAGRTDWNTPATAQEAMVHSFTEGAKLLDFVVQKMHYPGTWLQFIMDMRPSWFFTPVDVSLALKDELTPDLTQVKGIRMELGYAVQPDWIDQHFPEMSDYPEFAKQHSYRAQLLGKPQEDFTFNDDPEEDESMFNGDAITFTDEDDGVGRSRFIGNATAYSDGDLVPPNWANMNEEEEKTNIPLAPYKPEETLVDTNTSIINEPDCSERTNTTPEREYNEPFRNIEQPASNPYGSQNIVIEKEQQQQNASNEGMAPPPEDASDDYKKLYKLYEQSQKETQNLQAQLQSLQHMLEKFLSMSLDDTEKKHNAVNNCNYKEEVLEDIDDIIDRQEPYKKKVYQRNENTDSRWEFQRKESDFKTMMGTQNYTNQYVIQYGDQTKMVTSNMISKKVTQAILSYCRGDINNLKALAITEDGQIIINGCKMVFDYDDSSPATISDVLFEEIINSQLAKYINFNYLIRNAKNLRVLMFESRYYANDYIAPMINKTRSLNIEMIFGKLPRLQELWLEDRCYTRDRYRKQCELDYSRNDYAGDTFDNFRYTSVRFRDDQWEACKRTFKGIPMQFETSDTVGQKAWTLTKGLAKGLTQAVTSGISGVVSWGSKEINNARYQSRDFED